LSNFIKYNYVQQKPQTKARVINSNPKMQEVLRGLGSAQNFEPQNFDKDGMSESPDGFETGIEADVVEQVPQITPEELLANAQEEANRILEDAQNQANKILKQADAQAQELFDEQKEAAIAEGQAQIESLLQEQKQALNAQLEQQSAQLQEQYNERANEMEEEIVNALCQVIAKTFGIFMDDKKEVLVYLVQKTISGIENGKNFRIRVSPENAKWIGEKLPEIREEFSSDMTIEVQHDASLDDTACIIETEYGIYHCGIDLQLKNLLKQLKALSI